VPDYSFRVFATTRSEAEEESWRNYDRRADMESRIADLKYDLGADRFCLKQLFATEAAFRRSCCSICSARSSAPSA